MKNYKFMSVLFFSVFVLVVGVFSCKFEEGEEKTAIKVLDPPTIELGDEGGLIVVFKDVTDTEFITVCRQKVTSDGDEPIIPIGQIFPKYFDTSAAIVFQDAWVVEESEYRYYGRYYSGGEYYQTMWSKSQEVKNAKLKNGEVSKLGDVEFTYDEETYTLTLDADIDFTNVHSDIETELEDNYDKEASDKNVYTCKVSVSNGTKTRLYKLRGVTANTELELRNCLEYDMMDVPITIDNLVYEIKSFDPKSEETDIKKKPVRQVLWSEPAKIKITGDGSSKNTLTVKSPTAMGGNYEYDK